jgi:hypothetical protein
MGVVLAVIGALLMALGYFQSGAPGFSDTLNIGLLNDKSNLIAVGGYVFVGGIVLHAKEAIVEALAPSAAELKQTSRDDVADMIERGRGDDGAVV